MQAFWIPHYLWDTAACAGLPLCDGAPPAPQGYYLRGLKMMNVAKELAEEHYVDLSSKPFYPGLVNYIIRQGQGCCACRPVCLDQFAGQRFTT